MTKGTRRLAAVLSAFAVLCAVFILFIYPQQQESLSETGRELELLKHRKQLLDVFRDTAGDAGQLARQEKLLQGMLPKEAGTAAFLDNLQQWSRRSGVRLVKVAPGEEKRYEAYREQSLAVTVRGSYFEWLDFLYLLEQDGRFARIEDMRGHSDDTGVFEGMFVVYIYSLN